jgi:lipopolysaccharide/colanic/teichoic acid biosynthesis glycosyltransferase
MAQYVGLGGVPQHAGPWRDEKVVQDENDRLVASPAVDHGGLHLVVDLRATEPEFLYLQRSWQLRLKRVIDIIGALFALLILSPLLGLTALAVACTSPGPVFFRQVRVGQFGKTFSFLKFRSMYVDAEERKADFEALNQHSSGPIFKIRDDPRMTPVGRIIRKLSIDELPQLFHVLSGKMSLVGPRPPLPAEVAKYRPHEHARLLAKPGLTCIWQVSGRSDLDFDTWVAMDISYLRDWNLWLDLKLLAKTIPAVLSGKGAY